MAKLTLPERFKILMGRAKQQIQRKAKILWAEEQKIFRKKTQLADVSQNNWFFSLKKLITHMKFHENFWKWLF